MAKHSDRPSEIGVGDGRRKLTVASMVASAYETLKTYPARVLVTGFVVFGIATAIDIVGVEIAKRDRVPTVDVAFLAGFMLSLFGITFYTGLLDRLVGEGADDKPPSIYEVMKTLPYLKLIGANFVLVVSEILATSMFVLPGLVAITLLCATGPVVNQERNGLVESLRRSAHLVWPHFWLAFVLVTVPYVLQSEIVTGLYALLDSSPAYVQLTTVLVVGIALGIAVGLLEVALGDALMENDAFA